MLPLNLLIIEIGCVHLHDAEAGALAPISKKNIVGVDDKTDMSEDYNKFYEFPPFRVKTDPCILLNEEDSP